MLPFITLLLVRDSETVKSLKRWFSLVQGKGTIWNWRLLVCSTVGFSAPHGNHFLFLMFLQWCHGLLLNLLSVKVFYNWLCLVHKPANNTSPFCSSHRYGKIVSTKAILDKTTNKCKGVSCSFFCLTSTALFYLSWDSICMKGNCHATYIAPTHS